MGEKRFITSPTDIEIHHKVDLTDAIIDETNKQQFKKLYIEYQDVFTVDLSDIGKTKLITMDIDIEDSPATSQKHYTLPLKHVVWVQKKLELLEKADIIVRSVSPWESLIVIVCKRSQPSEPLRRRLHVDYRALNSLLLPVSKAHLKAKGLLILVSLPKIGEIYARLIISCIYSTFAMRSGYHHIELSKESQPKSAL